MHIKQFEDSALAHYSYAILNQQLAEIVLIDPSRDISAYIEYADQQGAKITAVIETHPHADFVSGHLELHQTTGATLYCSKWQQATYPHQSFDDGDTIEWSSIRLRALNTPGHSPDSICIVLEENGKDRTVFTGDTLFIGDVGRPDLRENTADVSAKREELARRMYYSLHNKLMKLDDDIIVYPAHGAGTLCGKSLSAANSSTIGSEKLGNWSLQNITEASFVQQITTEQPFVPKYFPYAVSLNRTGAEPLATSLQQVPVDPQVGTIEQKTLIIDTRPESEFKKGHLPNSINLQDGNKFETWLGSIVAPEETFYLAGASEAAVNKLITRAAKIGYERFIKKGFVLQSGPVSMDVLPLDEFEANNTGYTIVDVRNNQEVNDRPIFAHAVHIPLHELRERITEIPADKPIVVHCAGGYRSAIGSSIIHNAVHSKTRVFDLGHAIKEFL